MNQSDNKSPTETGQPMPLDIDRALGVLIQSATALAEMDKRLPHESEVDPDYLHERVLDLDAQRQAIVDAWARRALPSPAPTMTPEPYSVPEAEDLLALFKLAAMDGYNPKPVGTVDDWVEEGKKRIFLLYLAGKRDSAPSPAPTPEAADG